MNGIHDLGGMDGFGPVIREEHEPVFHENWERCAFGIHVAVRAERYLVVDEYRHAVERLPPVQYLTMSYYERQLAANAMLLVEKGLLTQEEIEARTAAIRRGEYTAMPRREDVKRTRELLRRIFREPEVPHVPGGPRAAFHVGDWVRVRNMHPKGHTRAPRYIRGKVGIIARYFGHHPLPDAVAHGRGPAPEPLYSVRFDAREVWGPDYPAGDTMYLALWQSYLEPAKQPRAGGGTR